MSPMRSTETSEDSRSLKETSLLAVASILGFLVGLVRTKILAVAWGPVGMGALGMMQASMAIATLVSGLGIDGVVPRELAKVYPHDPVHVDRVVAGATRGAALIGLVGALLALGGLWLVRDRLGLGSSAAVAILSVGVVTSVVGMNLRAILAGVGMVKRVASIGVLGALLATAVAVGLLVFPARAEYWAAAVVSVPTAHMLVSAWYVSRLPVRQTPTWRDSIASALMLSRQSSLFAVAGIMVVLSQLVMRSVARIELSEYQFGCFQAAMTLCAASVSVLASSVGPSVLPRLSAVSADPKRMSEIMEQQTGAYLTLFLPVVLAFVALPEIVLRLLYSDKFYLAAEQLPWQMVGELLRLPCWVMATVLVVKGRSRAYLLMEIAALVIGGVLVWGASRFLGLGGVGVAISLSTTLYFLVLVGLIGRDGVVWSTAFLVRLALLVGGVGIGAWLAHGSLAGKGVVLVACVVSTALAVRSLSKLRRGQA